MPDIYIMPAITRPPVPIHFTAAISSSTIVFPTVESDCSPLAASAGSCARTNAAKMKKERIYTLFETLSLSLALNASAEAFVLLLLKKFNILVECANTEAATELKE